MSKIKNPLKMLQAHRLIITRYSWKVWVECKGLKKLIKDGKILLDLFHCLTCKIQLNLTEQLN